MASVYILQLGEIGSTAEDGNKWSVWLDGGIHAREHITPATVIYIADQVCLAHSVFYRLRRGI